MDNLKILTLCDDSSCCCFTPRSTAALIALIGLWACLLDVLSNDSLEVNCGEIREHLANLRNLLLPLFQMANMLLLLGSIVKYFLVAEFYNETLGVRVKLAPCRFLFQERASLLQIYLWYMLAFIVIALVVALGDFCFRARDEGAWSCATFVPEIILLFVLFRCLPLVDTYRKRLEEE